MSDLRCARASPRTPPTLTRAFSCSVAGAGAEPAGHPVSGVVHDNLRGSLGGDVALAGVGAPSNGRLRQPLRRDHLQHRVGACLRNRVHRSERRSHQVLLPGLLPRLLHGKHSCTGRMVS